MSSDLIASAKLNRQRFRKQLGSSIAVFYGRKDVVRNNDVHYPFRQHSNFYHLTGFNEPGAKLILTKEEEILFIPGVSEFHLVWIGEAETPASAKKKYSFGKVLENEAFTKSFEKSSRGKKKCLAESHIQKDLKKMIKHSIEFDESALNKITTELRSVKNKYELKMMSRICRLTSQAHKEVMKKTKAGMYEDQIENVFSSFLRSKRVRELSYPAIVATGVNSATLHYVKNTDKLKKGQLLLIDAGGEECGYAADITRTFPVSGKFTKKQKEIYDIVLKTQKDCIRMIKPGIYMSEIQKKSQQSLTEGLLKCGILLGDLKSLMASRAVTLFYPHGVSHMLGLDVHDATPKVQSKTKEAGNIRSQAILKSGNIITVEPGLYFIKALLDNPENRKKFKTQVDWKKVKNYEDFGGIRIEDDVLVTDKSHQVITSVPKETKAIEKLMASA